MVEGYEDKITCILARLEKLKTIKNPWLNTYELIARYIMGRQQGFTSTMQDGQFLTGQTFDATAPNALQTASTALIGYLWPNSARTFRIDPPEGISVIEANSSKAVKDYYVRVTRVLRGIFDSGENGFNVNLQEFMNDHVGFGVAGLAAFEEDDDENPVRFAVIDVKRNYIAENNKGFVDTVYVVKEMTVRQLVQEFGKERTPLDKGVSEKTLEAFKEGRLEDKVQVLHAVEPRMEGSKATYGNASFPIASIHIEVNAKHELNESGYPEMPIFISRYIKKTGEVYGRCPGTESMPDILEANQKRETSLEADEKMLRPPVEILDDGSYGGVIDLSADAKNVRRMSGRMNDASVPMIRPIFTVGEVQWTHERLVKLEETIMKAFGVDRLLDLENQQRMTLGEANIRNELRAQSLGNIFARLISEVFDPLIKRVFNIAFSRGLLGVIQDSPEHHAWLADPKNANKTPWIIPEEVVRFGAEGGNLCKPTFISPAQRIMQTEEATGIQRVVDAAINMAPVFPNVVDNIDEDIVALKLQELTGASVEIIRSSDDIKKLREGRQKQQEAMMNIEAAKSQADTAKSAAGAAKAGAEAQATAQGA